MAILSRRDFGALTLGVSATALAGGVPAAFAQDFVTVLTGGTSGVYYPLGVSLAKIYADNIKGINTNAQSTKASVENLNLLQAGRGEVAFSLGDSVADAWEGNQEAGFPQKLDRLRAIGAIYPNFIQIVARADANIRSLQDLKGKRVSVGAPRSGTELNARAVFGAAGMSYKDFGRVEYLPFAESVELVKNRQIDATLQSAGLGVASIRDLAATNAITVVPVPAEVVEKIGNPVYIAATIPANTYEGQTEEVPTAAVVNLLVTREGLSDDLVYQMTRLVFDNRDTLVAAHSAAKSIDLAKAVEGLPIPLHPGAERFYREAGVLK